MPKEVVRARPELDDGAGAYIRVGWSKESDTVELATAVPEGAGRLMVPDRDPHAAPDAWGVVAGVEDAGSRFIATAPLPTHQPEGELNHDGTEPGTHRRHRCGRHPAAGRDRRGVRRDR